MFCYRHENKRIDYGPLTLNPVGEVQATEGNIPSLDSVSFGRLSGIGRLTIQQYIAPEDPFASVVVGSAQGSVTDLGITDITSLFSNTVTVRYTNPTLGSLKVTKTVKDDKGNIVSGSDEIISFTLTLTAPLTTNNTLGNAHTDNVAVTLPSEAVIKAADGTQKTVHTISWDAAGSTTIKFTLKNGESLLFENLPVGTEYTITEDEIIGYYPGIVITKADGTQEAINDYKATGTVTNTRNDVINGGITDGADKTDTSVDFTNNLLTTGSLTVNKVVDGTPEAGMENSFDFTVELEFDNAENYLLPALSVTNGATEGWTLKDPAGTIYVTTVTATISDGEEFTIGNIPVGTTYTVNEKAVNDFTSSVDGVVGTPGGEIFVPVSTGELSEDKTVNVTNTYNFTSFGDIIVTKTVIENDGTEATENNEDFIFTVTLDATGTDEIYPLPEIFKGSFCRQQNYY